MADPINVVINDKTHRFEASLNGEVAFAEYRLESDAMVLPHTVVPDAFAGRGVGGALARAALDYAQAHRLKVKPSCSFVAAYIQKHPEFHELVHATFRPELGL